MPVVPSLNGSQATDMNSIPVDDELEAATRFSASEDDEDEVIEVNSEVIHEVNVATAEIWQKAADSKPGTVLPDMAL